MQTTLSGYTHDHPRPTNNAVVSTHVHPRFANNAVVSTHVYKRLGKKRCRYPPTSTHVMQTALSISTHVHSHLANSDSVIEQRLPTSCKQRCRYRAPSIHVLQTAFSVSNQVHPWLASSAVGIDPRPPMTCKQRCRYPGVDGRHNLFTCEIAHQLLIAFALFELRHCGPRQPTFIWPSGAQSVPSMGSAHRAKCRWTNPKYCGPNTSLGTLLQLDVNFDEIFHSLGLINGFLLIFKSQASICHVRQP